ncbi:BatD family protein [Entomospira nematocerorum]|uniref:Protein BatD n=1 Tax=Entomospira nematocerorum TaxID=2719987 RepID=A0A968GEH7_9SPIO|nr:BatD family protein [Entomospira nematocera]NIZ46810.1 protein BatD [Entomospira nematocera]WDI33393.1 BatD family protein [Entomospira nematocera]
MARSRRYLNIVLLVLQYIGLSFLSIPFVYAEVSISEHEENFTTGFYRLNQERIYRDVPFELTLVFPVAYTTNSHLLAPSDFPDNDLQILQGPTPAIKHTEEGATLEYRYVLQAKREGAISINSFAVRTRNEYSRIAPFYIEVTSIEKRGKQAPQLIWNGIPKTLYQGESFQAELLFIYIDEHWSVASTPIIKTSGLIMEETLTYVQKTEYNNLPALRLGKWLFFAGSIGKKEISQVSININGIPFRSDPVFIDVKPLPLPQPTQLQANAIGNFKLRLLYDPPDPSHLLRVRIQLSGEGSLHLVTLPSLSYDGMKLIHKDSVHFMQPSARGYTGYQEDIYLLSIYDYSSAQISLEEFQWFDPEANSYQVEGEQIITFINKKIPIQSHTYIPHISMSGFLDFNGDLTMKPYLIAIFIWILLYLFICIVFRKKKRKSLQFFSHTWPLLALFLFTTHKWPTNNLTLQQAQQALNQGQWETAITLMERMQQELSTYPLQGALSYNLAVAHQHLHNNIEKRYYLLQASQLAPLSKLFRDALIQENLEHLVEDRRLEHRIFVTIFWVFSIILVILPIIIAKKPLTWLQSMIYLLLVTSLFLTSLYSLHRRQPTIAIVVENVKALRIPDERATYGENLLRGDVLFVGGIGRGYVQLSDRETREGWVLNEHIWMVNKK